MVDKLEKNKRKQKKPYVKPELTEYQLSPDEAILGGCKYTGSAGPYQGTCNQYYTCYTFLT
mgnify:CR=1 FL=1